MSSAVRLPGYRMRRVTRALFACAMLGGVLLVNLKPAGAQKPEEPKWSAAEKPIAEQIQNLRKLPDDVRARTTRQLALEIRQLPASPNKVLLAAGLASRATEGDFGHDTLQEVATTVADALRQQPPPDQNGQPAAPYIGLAELVRYENMKVSLDAPQFQAAMAKLEADDRERERADFTLTDLQGKSWNLRELKGKVVLVNFWATWCQPCQKEMPDLEALYNQFKDRGFVILAIADDDLEKVKPFIAARGISYPVMIDPQRRVTQEFQVEGIPKSFVYNRDGKLVAQSIDMRTRQQFLAMLQQAGLQ